MALLPSELYNQKFKTSIKGGITPAGGITSTTTVTPSQLLKQKQTGVYKPKPIQTQPIVVTPKVQPKPLISPNTTATLKSMGQNIFASLGGVQAKAGNLIDSVFAKKETLISPIPKEQMVKYQQPTTVQKVSKTVSDTNKKLGEFLFKEAPFIPTEYKENFTTMAGAKGFEKTKPEFQPTAGKFVGGMIDEVLLSTIGVGGVSLAAKTVGKVPATTVRIAKGIKTAAMFTAFQGLLSTIKEEKVSLDTTLIMSGLGFLIGYNSPSVMVGYPKTDINNAKYVLKDFGFTAKDLTNAETMKSKFRSVAMKLHPDKGGKPEDFKKFVDAYNKSSSAGINPVWSLADTQAYLKYLWNKQGMKAEELYQKANSTFKSYLEKVVKTGKSTVELTPKAVNDIVVGSNLEKSPLGKIMLKLSLRGSQVGQNLAISQLDKTMTGDNIAVSPQGTNVGVRLVQPTESADKPPVTTQPAPQKAPQIAPSEAKPAPGGVGEMGKYKNAEEFAVSNLGGKLKDGIAKFPNNQLWLNIKESPTKIILNNLEVEERGRGIGTKFINELKNYADKTGKELEISQTVNENFFQRFDFLKPNYGELGKTTFSYKPNQATKNVAQLPKAQGVGEMGKVLYHGTTEQYADVIQRRGFKVPISSQGVSLTDDFEMAKSYADRGGKDVIAVRVKPGAKPIPTKEGVDVLTGEYLYNPSDLEVIGRGKNVAQLPKSVKAVTPQPTKPTTAKPKKVIPDEKAIREYVNTKKTKFRLDEGDLILARPGREVTTKFLEHSDVKNKDFTSYSFLYNLSKSDTFGLKQSERTVVQETLDKYFKDQKKIDMKEFRQTVLGEVMPLDLIKSDSWSNYGSDNVGLDGSDKRTYLLNSPFEHGQTGHFSADFGKTLPATDLEIREIPAQPQNPRAKFAVIHKGVTLTRENIEENVFNLANTREEAQAWIDKHSQSNRYATGELPKTEVAIRRKGLFASIRTFDMTENDTYKAPLDRLKISHIAEIQSDVFQSGRAERLGKSEEINKAEARLADLQNNIKVNKIIIEENQTKIIGYDKAQKLIDENNKDFIDTVFIKNFPDIDIIPTSEKYGIPVSVLHRTPRFAIAGIFDKPRAESWLKDSKDYSEQVIETNKNSNKKLEEEIPQSEKFLKEISVEPPKEEKQFKSYQNIWQERAVREIINIKAQEGFKVLRFPTPRTVALIEGYVNSEERWETMLQLSTIPYEVTFAGAGDEMSLEVGDTIDFGGEEMTVLEADSSSITVAPSEGVHSFSAQEAMDEDIQNRWDDAISEFRDVEKLFGNVTNSNKAADVKREIETLNNLIAFNNKEKDIAERKKRYEESTSVLENKKILKEVNQSISLYKKFEQLIREDIIKKQGLTLNKITSLDFKYKLEKKYGISYLYWNYIVDNWNKDNSTMATVKDMTLDDIKRILDRKEGDLMVAASDVDKDRKEFLDEIKEIQARKKPTTAEIKTIPTVVLKDYSKRNYPYYLNEADLVLDKMIEEDSEKFSLDDFEDSFKEMESQDYEFDFEGVYGKNHVFFTDEGNDQTVWITEKDTESFMQPDQYDEVTSIDDFDINNFSGEQKTVLQYYDKQVNKYLEKLRRGNLEKVTDDNGNEWLETKVTADDLKPPTAYRLADDFAKVGIKITPQQENEVVELNKNIFGDTNVKITAQILANQKALASYSKGMIKILAGQADPKGSFYHEAVHKYLDSFTDKQEYIDILKVAQKEYQLENISQVEEKLAEDFINYAKKREGVFGVLKAWFDKLLKRLKKYFKNEDKINSLYDDILSGKAKVKAEVKAEVKVKPVEVAKPTTIKPPKELPMGGMLPVVSKGKLRESRAYQRIKNELAEEVRLDANYNILNLDKDTEKALEFLAEQPKESLKVSLGLEEPPVDITDTHISIAAADRAKAEGDDVLRSQLSLARSLRQTRRGQEIVSERGSANDNTAEHFIKQVMDKRMIKLGSSLKGALKEVRGKNATAKKSALEKIDQNVVRLKKEMKLKQLKIKSAQDFIDSLRC